jgi:hypothetical protein
MQRRLRLKDLSACGRARGRQEVSMALREVPLYLGGAPGRSRQPGYAGKLGHDALHAGAREYGRSIVVGLVDQTVCGGTSW